MGHLFPHSLWFQNYLTYLGRESVHAHTTPSPPAPRSISGSFAYVDLTLYQTNIRLNLISFSFYLLFCFQVYAIFTLLQPFCMLVFLYPASYSPSTAHRLQNTSRGYKAGLELE